MKDKFDSTTNDNKELKREVEKVTNQLKMVEDELFKLREDHTSKESNLEGANQDKERIKGQVRTLVYVFCCFSWVKSVYIQARNPVE